ncbi:uncharacterized protein LOC135390613 isoform X2 [Ornithodoros turicata]|uniref:uncharacterized protein LOC135390613 isoform X2 n=1 Tax=Ornithodoros turicata TaxID=34597 RepID=UPI0031398606
MYSHEAHSTPRRNLSRQHLLDAGQDSPRRNKIGENIFKYSHLVRVEVFLSLYVFSRMSIKTPIQALVLRKTCLYSLNLNSTICDNLALYPAHQDQVDAIGSRYSMYGVIVSLGPSALISSFAGPWCDKYGYRTPILLGNIGFLFTLVSVLCTVFWMSLPLYANVLANIPDGICGGIITILAAVYSEATVSTPERNRFIKFFGLNLVFVTLSQAADMVGGLVLHYAGFSTVVLVSLATCAVAEVWVLFSFSDKASDDTVSVKVQRFFRAENLKEGFRTFIKQRPGSRRSQIWCVFVAMILLTVDYSANNLGYFYTSKMYSWNVAYYGFVQCIASLGKVLVNVPLLWLLTQRLRIGDPVMAIFGSCFITVHLVLLAFAYADWLYYVRKIFSFLSTCESLMPVLGDALFTQVLNLSISFFPGLVFATSAIISVVPVILLGYCTRVSRGPTASTSEPGEQ